MGFAIADLREDNIWALFIHPEFEGEGIEKKLQKMMLDWYFSMNKEKVWLGTASGTRARDSIKHQGGPKRECMEQKSLNLK